MLVAIAVEAGLIALAVAGLVGHGLVVLARDRVRRRRLTSLRATLVAGLEQPATAAVSGAFSGRWSQRLALIALAELAPALHGSQRASLARLAAEAGLVRRAERLCLSRRWRRRLRGARLLSLLGGGESAVPVLLGDPQPQVRAQAVEWAADHPTPANVERLLGMLTDEPGVSPFVVKDSLVRLGPAVVEPLATRLASVRGAGAVPLLEIAVWLNDPRLLAPALSRCGDRDARVRALAAGLIGGLGGADGVRALERLVADPEGAVRAAAIQSLGKLGHWPAAALIAARLGDQSWEVRRAAALALRSLEAPGELLLRRALSDPDPFARDMAKQVLDLPELSPSAASGR
jgi:HEAT repeat protein